MRQPFTYPLNVDKGKVDGKYEIIKSFRAKNGALLFWFVVEKRVYVGIAEVTIIMEKSCQIIHAKLAKNQNLEDYQIFVVEKPTRSKSRAKIRPKQHSLEKSVLPQTYSEEKYSDTQVRSRAFILTEGNHKEKVFAVKQALSEHYAEIEKRKRLEKKRAEIEISVAEQVAGQVVKVGGVDQRWA